MAQCKQTPYEFVQNAFSPLVAVLSSAPAEQLCRKNNLSFIEMVQPFNRLTTDVHFRDPLGATVTVKNLRLCLQDVHSRPPQPTLARKFLNESVSSALNDNTSTFMFGNQKIDVPASTPWFEAWRETFLQVQFPADHEFTKHFLGCVIVVSSSEASPIDAIRALRHQLQSLQSVAPGKLPKWMATPSPPLIYHLLLHDVMEGDSVKSEATLSQLKAEYGANNCYLLNINSRPPGQQEDVSHVPDPWSQFLSRHSDVHDMNEYDSSPITPAEISGVSGMPSRVSTDDTEVAQEAVHDAVLETAQEAGTTSPVPVLQHPLSPQEDGYHLPDTEKGSIGNHHMNIPINSNVWAGTTVPSPLPNSHLLPHGAFLTALDLDHIRVFIQDMCAHALLPHIEKQIQQLNDQISNKKSVSRSLLGATKRWFGTNKPGAPNSNVPNNAVIYSSDAPELQIRRMGDLCFMFRHYKLAFEAYHSAKRDFAADGAWLYYAGALEMASLAAFMMGESTRKAQEYSEEAILTYLNTCRLQQFATRGTLLSTECLKSRAQYGDAAKQLLRMTSEDSDLRSALLLEQAALCYLQASKPPMVRKFAFHMVLAGHRFNKAGQKRHSLRCYQLAYQVYKGKGWSLAEDHIHFTLGRQAANLRQTELSVQAFARLFSPASKQSPPQQAAFLREYLLTHQQLPLETGILPTLPLPLVDNSSLAVLVGPIGSAVHHNPVVYATGMTFVDDSPDIASTWLQLEEKLLLEAQGSAPMIFKPLMVLFTNQTDNSVRPNAVLGEPVSVSVSFQNPLGISLPLTNVYLLWAFRPGVDDSKQDEVVWVRNESNNGGGSDHYVQTHILPQLSLEPCSSCNVSLSVIPCHIGDLKIEGIAYRINYAAAVADGTASGGVTSPTTSTALSVQGKQVFVIQAKRVLRVGKERPSQDKKLEDHRLELVVVPSAPQLQVKLSGLPSEMLCGELQKVEVELMNVGTVPIKNLLIGSSTPHLISVADLPFLENGPKGLSQVQRVPLPNMLSPRQHILLTMWLRAPDVPGASHLRILFYYDCGISSSVPKYRLVRHSWPLSVLESVQISAEANRSQALNAEEVINVNMRVTNSNKVQDLLLTKVTLSQVSVASLSWVLGGIPFTPSQQDTVLSSQESVQLLLRLSRCLPRKQPIFTDSKLSSPLLDSLEPSTNRPFKDFVQRHSEWGSLLSSLENSKPTDAALSINAAIILRWTAAVMDSGGAVRTAFGQTHLILSKLNKRVSCPPLIQASAEKAPASLKIFGPDRNVPSESDSMASKAVTTLETLQQLVAYSLHHQARLSHDFNRRRLCIVNVQLILQNCCDSPLFVKVNLTSSPSGMPSKSQLYLPHASSVVRWVGRLVSHIELPARSTHTLPLLAAIPGPGTYNLGAHLQILCRLLEAPEKDTITQRMKVESAIVISDKGKEPNINHETKTLNGTVVLATS